MAETPRTWRLLARRAASAGAWACCATVLLWFGAHQILDDSGFGRALFHLATPAICLPASAALLLGAASGKRALGALSVACAAGVALSLGVLGVDLGPRPAQVCLRVAYANVLMVHDRPELLYDELMDLDADVLYLAEYAPQFESFFASGPVEDVYPYRFTDPQVHSFGNALLSKHPVDVERVDLAGVDVLRVRGACAGRSYTLLATHLLPPRNAALTQRWHGQLAALRALVAETAGPVIVAGDLNATWHHPSFRGLGLRSAHLDRGQGFSRSWPNSSYCLPFSVVRLDHLLLSEELAVADVRNSEGVGSDHRPLVAEIGWR